MDPSLRQEIETLIREVVAEILADRDAAEEEGEYYRSLAEERHRRRMQRQQSEAEEERRRLGWRVDDLEAKLRRQ